VKPLPHQYSAHLSAEPLGYAEVGSPGLPTLRVAAPVDYDGPGDAWSPEHLLLAAVQSCLLLTFRALAKVSQLPFVRLEVETSGTVDRKDGVTRFTEILLRPRLTVPAGTSHERAQRILERSEKACLVSESLATPIRMEHTILEADTVLAAV
jgi:peroxiredoxin-like protein